MAKKKNGTTKIESIRHKDKRKNIPTEELRDFVADEEHAPKTMLYPRDPSLDPQLVWKGKDEQDRADLAVPAVPIYIQEKIHPQAIIDDLLAPARQQAEAEAMPLFADFNGGPKDFDQKIDFYHHDQNWSNRMILGDSLLVMTSLAEKEGLKGKVQTIYLDPPYGIKFGSNWQVSTRKPDVKDGKAADATRQPEQVRAFRDTWKLGIHSYLAYLRERLILAHELLTDTGSVFVQIGDENVHLVRCILDEVFGSDNFLVSIVVKKKSITTVTDPINDYLLWYSKNAASTKIRTLTTLKSPFDEDARFRLVEFANGERKPVADCARDELIATDVRYLNDDYPLVSQDESETRSGIFNHDGRELRPGKGRHWTYDPGIGMRRIALAGRIRAAENTARGIVYFDDFGRSPIPNIWEFHGERNQVYVVQTNRGIVERCVLMTTDPGDLVLDPTCGSGTTAYVAEQWGRRWITCDTSRVALALARTRLMSTKYPYYLLADSPEGVRKEAELTGQTPPDYKNEGDIRKGFVYKRVPHVTLKAIANNPDIKEGMSRAEINAAIARHAETEILYDQPYEDNKRVRVCGPFSVESLSPHRTISAQEKAERSVHFKDGRNLKVVGPDNFGHMVLENLRKAGVQNNRKGERLKFDSLDPFAGEWIHGRGTYTEADATERRAAICIGPEHGTVGATLIKEAAKEAVKGVGFDVLIVCGFAFDPSVSEEAKRYGKLTVLPTKMNPDLAMGDELLKKTGAGNLFMVFGEPDIEIRRISSTDDTEGHRLKKKAKAKKDDHLCPSVQSVDNSSSGASADHLIVEVRGLDVYDPTTGQVRNSIGTEDIACWFIDTNYNGESFFVRHAYFTGAASEKDGGPYDKLKRALRAEIDESAWSQLYSTTSRPFAKPQGEGGRPGKIAVKVINHYGDEVLKVYEV